MPNTTMNSTASAMMMATTKPSISNARKTATMKSMPLPSRSYVRRGETRNFSIPAASPWIGVLRDERSLTHGPLERERTIFDVDPDLLTVVKLAGK